MINKDVLPFINDNDGTPLLSTQDKCKWLQTVFFEGIKQGAPATHFHRKVEAAVAHLKNSQDLVDTTDT